MKVPIYTGDFPTDEMCYALGYNMILDNNERKRLIDEWRSGEIENVFWIECSDSGRELSIITNLMKKLNNQS